MATPTPAPTDPSVRITSPASTATAGRAAPSATPDPGGQVEVIAGLPPTPSPVSLAPEAYPAPPERGPFSAYPGPADQLPTETVAPEWASVTAVAADRAATATAVMASASPTAPVVSGGDLVFAGGLLRLTLPSEWRAAPDATGALLANGELTGPDLFRSDAGIGSGQVFMRLTVIPLVEGRSPETIEAAWVTQARADLRANQQVEGPYHFQVSGLVGRAYVAPLQAIGRIDRVLTAFFDLGDGFLLLATIVPYDAPGYNDALGVLSSLVRVAGP